MTRQRLAARVVEEFLEQRAADALRQAAGDLALDQHRIDRPADVVGDEIALDGDGAGVAVDAHHGDVHAIGIVHVVRLEPAFGGKARRRVAEELRGRRERARDLAERDRRSGAASLRTTLPSTMSSASGAACSS